MGLVVKDDGWRIPDRVWVLMEPLCRRGRRIRLAVITRVCPIGTR